MPAHQYEQKKEYMRSYYQENKDVIILKQKLRRQKKAASNADTA